MVEVCQGRNVGVGTSGAVVGLAVSTVLVDPRVDNSLLVIRLREDVGEAAARAGPSVLRVGTVRTADSGDPGASSRVFRVVSATGTVVADTVVSRSNEDGNTLSSKLREKIACLLLVVCGNSSLEISIGDGDRLGELILGESKQVVDEFEVRLIIIGPVGGRSATSAIVDVGDLLRDGTDVLHVKTSLKSSRGTGWAFAVVDGSAGVALVLIVLGSISVHELREVVLVGILLKKSSDAHESIRVSLGSAVVVQAGQTRRGDVEALASRLT